MKKSLTLILLVLFCICGYAQTIDPILLQEMGQRGDDEKIKVVVIMKSQYDRQQLGRRAAHYVTRAERREFVVDQLKRFSQASQYDLRNSLNEMERYGMTTAPTTLWMANALYFSATKQAINDLAMRNDIEIIGFDEERQALYNNEESQPANITRGITTNVTQVNANQVWNLGYTGQGVVVAIIDSGVNYNHLDLADHLWDGGTAYPHHGYDFYNNDNDPMDDIGQGTHCAGTICGDGTAGSQTGVAPDATLMCVKVLSEYGDGSASITCNAMQWAVEQGCDVISISFGWTNSSITERTLFRNTCVAVMDAGVIGAMAAGDYGNYYQSYYPIPNNVQVPGSCPPPYMDPIQANNSGGLSCAVSVGAINNNNSAYYYTSRGPVTWSNTGYADYPYTEGSGTEFGLIRPDVCAPGADIISADYNSNSGYTTMSGTSMATPCVAGCMSLLLSKNIDASPAEICKVLEETAVPLADGKSNIFGYGCVDALAAINALYTGPLTLDAFVIDDGQGNNDSKLNAGESVTFDFTLTNDSNIALDGATMVLTAESEYVTLTNGTATLPHFNAHQTRTVNDIFSFTLSENAPATNYVSFLAEAFVNGESLGITRFNVMVYGSVLSFEEVSVLNDNNNNGALDPGETANLHVIVSNNGNDLASSIVGTLSTSYPYLTINDAIETFGNIAVGAQASANFNVTLSNSAPNNYTINFSLDLVDANAIHNNVEFELWKRYITLTSNPAGAGALSGGGSYAQGQTCTITATANNNYAFVNWTLDGEVVSYMPTYSFTVADGAQYVANFKQINGIVIGEPTTSNSYLPTYSYYPYSLTQQIYTATEMKRQPGQISSVSFFNTGSAKTRNLTVYLVHTDKTAFASNTDWIAVTEDDIVFNGNVSLTGYDWATIYFPQPFTYDGSSNLALIVDDNTGSWNSGLSCRTYNTTGNQAIRISGSSTNYNPYTISSSGTRMTVKNEVIFGYASYDCNVTVSANPSAGGTVGGDTGWHYVGQQVNLTATANPGYVFTNWTKNGEIVADFATSNVTVTETANYIANFQQVEGIVIGEGTNDNPNLPFYSYYPYSLSQQIYTAAEMGSTACDISSVTFYNTTSSKNCRLAIYMVATNKTSFGGNSDWITVTENDMVFNGNVTINSRGWTTINFNKVFHYNGSSNVALVVDDNSQSWYRGLSFRTFNTNSNQSIRISGSGINYDPYTNTYSGTLAMEKNQVIFGFPSYDYEVSVTVNPLDGGTVSGSGMFFQNQSCTLTASPNEGYCFYNWTRNGSVVSSNPTYTFTVTSDVELVANFGTPLTINVSANPVEGGSVSGGGDYGYNQSCTITATANDGYVFTKWTRNGSTVSYLSTYTFTVSTSNAGEYVANFDQVDGIAIGEATAANAYLPIYTYNPYSLSQQIYTAEELNSGTCEISSVSFFNMSWSRTRNLTVYMVHTNKTAFNSSTDWIPVTEANKVFSGDVTLNYTGWATIYFTTPFSYDGSSNIALVIDDNTGLYESNLSCRTFSTSGNQAIYITGAETNYNMSNLSAYTGTLLTVKNQVIFGHPSYEYSLTVTAVPDEGGMVSGGGGLYFYGQPVPATATANPGYVFNYWTKYVYNGYYGYDQVVSCLAPENLSVTGDVEYKAHFQQMDGVVVGDPHHTNRYLPTNSDSPYSLTQQIYTAEELNTGACEISSLSFFNTGYYITRNLSIYMVNTDKTSFNSISDWISVTDDDLVFSGNVDWQETNWLTVYFSTPFSYDGTSNVALVIYDKTGDWNWGVSCRTFDTQGTQAIYAFDDYNINVNNPIAVATLVSEKNQVVFGIPSYDYSITVSANPEEGGTVNGGGGQYYYGQPVTISATPNPGYVFDRWTKYNVEYDYDEDVSYLATDDVSVTEITNYMAHFLPMEGIIIGEAAHTTQMLPTYYYHSMSQQIFTADEMNSGACDISSVSFFNTEYEMTRNLDIYMIHTDKTTFESPTDWVAVTENDSVLYSGNVSFMGYGWTTIYFSTPFSYDGMSNVVLVINDKTHEWSDLSCRTFDTEGTQSLYVYEDYYGSDIIDYDPFNPSEYAGELLTMKNQVVFGIADYQYTVSVTANPSGAGTVSGGGGLYYYGQPIPLAAEASNGYAFSSWTKNDEVLTCFPEYILSVTESAVCVANFRQVDGILVGTPSHDNWYLPTYSYNSVTQQIFTANEMKRQPSQISSVSFFNTGYTRTRNITVYMVHTDKTSFNSGTDWITVGENDPVLFSGSFVFPTQDWATVYFSTPFNYNGLSNVALIVVDNSNNYNYGDIRCRIFDTEDNQVLYTTGGYNVSYDPHNLSAYSGSRMSKKNQVIFGYTHYDYQVTATANPTEGGSVSGDTGWHYYGRPVTLVATAEEGYVFNNWTKNGEVVSYLSTYSFSVTETAEYVANFQQTNGILIGEGAYANYYLPTYTYYPYSLTQQIYTADELNTGSCSIASVSFFNTGSAKTRNLAVYMIHTNKTAFENTNDWFTVTEEDMVFNGDVTLAANGWATIYFNTMFEYNGTSNVALIVDDNTQNWNSGLRCRTFGTDGNQAIRLSGSGSNYNPYNPTGYTGTLTSEKNQVIFGFPDYGYTVTTSVNPPEGGTVSGGEGTYFMGQSCTLTATPNEGYVFNNWTLDGTVVSSSETYTFPVMGNMHLVANFGDPIMITTSVNPSGAGTVSGGGGYGYNHSCTLTATANDGYVFTKWTRNGSTVSYYSTYTFSVTAATEYVANFEQVDGIVVGNAVSSNSYLPAYTYYPYSLSQQIYTADEINSGACEISSISFFNATNMNMSTPPRDFSVYLVLTNKTAFDDATDWITVTEEDKVFSGHLTANSYSWVTIYFDRVFEYDGSSNIVLVVDDNAGIYGLSSMACRTYTTTENQSIRVSGSSIDYDPSNPTGFTGTLNLVKNQVIFGFPTYGHTLTLSANPSAGGTVSGGGGSYFYGHPVIVNATANPGYVFKNWTKNNNTVSYLSPDNLPADDGEYVANFQEMDGVVIGGAHHINRYLPSNSEYPYSLTQQIYTADELNSGACDVSSVSFFNTGYSKTRDLTIYMVNTTKSVFNNNNDWITVSENDVVYNGIVNLAGSNWTTIYFNTPFNYDGSSNVALVIYDKTNEWNSGLLCRTFDTPISQAIFVYNDYGINPNRPTTTGTLVSKKNQVVFGIPNYIYPLTLSANPEEGGTVSGGGGVHFYGQPVTISATPNAGYVFDKWTKYTEGTGSGEVISYLSPDIISVTDSLHYVAQFQPMDGIAIGEPTHATQYLPTHYYYYSLTQQIYTADEMGGEARDISSVSFYNTEYGSTRNLDIYMVNTNKSMFGSTNDWIAITQNDTVLYSGNVTFTSYGWTTIYFSKPFHYNGTSNVALVINDKTNSWNSNMNCRTFDAEGTQALYTYRSGSSYDPYNPFDYNGTLMSQKSQVVFGIADYQYTVSVSANPTEGGTVSGGGGLYYYGQPIPLIANANNNYAFSTWTKGDEVVSCFPDFNVTVTETAEYVANFHQVDGILVGEPSNSNSYLPTYSYNSMTQQIYTAAEMKRQPCQISSVSFFNTGSARTRNLTIYMVHTGKTSFENTTDWISVTENDPVLFSGNVTFPAKEWVTIYFATPFNYNGLSNVAMIVDDNSNSYNSGNCRTFNTEGNQTLRIGGSNVNYDPLSPADYTGTLMSMKNQVIFGYAHYNCNVTAIADPTEGGTVSGDMGVHYYGRPITLTASANNGYVFDNWTKDGEVVSYLSTYSFPVTGDAQYVANFHQIEGIAIGNPTSTSSYLPTYYYYSLTQQIYSSDEMGDEERQISSVSFFNTTSYTRNRNFTIYMVHTNKTSFENTTDWIAVTDADKVFSGSVSITATGWTTIYFSTPFEYDGTSNVALIVDDNTNSYNTYTSCRTFDTDDNQTIRISGSGTNYDPINPSGYTGILMSVKNQVVFGFPEYDYTVTATANPVEGGTISGGEGTFYLGESCTLTATPNEGYCFYNWTINGSVVSSEATYTFPVTGNMTLVANFGAPIVITATANPAEGGTVSGAGEFGLGHSCTLTATANAGYVFTKWTRNNSTVSYLSTYTFTVSANNAGEYVANFDQVDGIDIGNAVSTNSYLPTYSNYPYSLTQQIYTADEISSQACLISTVSFFNTGSARTRNLTVYLVQTDKTSFANNTDWITVTNNDKVFSGNVTLAGYGWATVYFEQPFLYNGSSNLALIVDDNTGSSASSMSCRTFSANGNQTIRVSGSNINYDPCNPTGFTGSLNTVKNQVVFGYTHYGYHVNVTANPPEGGSVNGGGSSFYLGQPHTVTATPNAGYCFYNWTINGMVVSSEATYTFPVTGDMELVANFGTPIIISATANPNEGGTISGAGSYGGTQTCTLTATANEGYVFKKWTRNGSTVSYLSTYTFTVTNNAQYVAVFDFVSPNIVIGDAEAVDSNLPSQTYYNYTLSQQIYTAQEIGRACKINSISFFNTESSRTRNYTIYLKRTNKSSFENTNDWIPVSEANQVFSGTVNMLGYGWTEITFDTPFYYDGISNVVLVVDDNTGSYTSSMSCRVINTESPQALYIYSDGTNYDAYNPSYSGTLVSVKNQIILDVSSSQIFTKEISAYTNDGGYYLLSFPTLEISPEEVEHMLDNTYDLYAFDESQPKEWRNYKAGTFILEPGKGYLYANSNDVNLSFEGSLYNGNGEVTLYKTGDAETAGWNLVGNPFAVRAYLNRDFYVMNNDGNEIVASERDYVEPMEGVFVVAEDNGETLTFSTTASAMCPRLVLNLNSGTSTGSATTVIDRAIVRFGEGTMLPKLQIMKNGSKLFIQQDGKDYAVVNSGNVGEMPVSFKAEANGTYTISISIQGVGFSYLHLIDTLTNRDIDLLSTTIYSFEASTTDKDERFKVVFAVDQR